MLLSDRDRAMLAGESGVGTRTAMELLVAVAESEQAPYLLDIRSAHIDGGLYHGQAGLDFALTLVEGGGKVVVPKSSPASKPLGPWREGNPAAGHHLSVIIAEREG